MQIAKIDFLCFMRKWIKHEARPKLKIRWESLGFKCDIFLYDWFFPSCFHRIQYFMFEITVANFSSRKKRMNFVAVVLSVTCGLFHMFKNRLCTSATCCDADKFTDFFWIYRSHLTVKVIRNYELIIDFLCPHYLNINYQNLFSTN